VTARFVLAPAPDAAPPRLYGVTFECEDRDTGYLYSAIHQGALAATETTPPAASATAASETRSGALASVDFASLPSGDGAATRLVPVAGRHESLVYVTGLKPSEGGALDCSKMNAAVAWFDDGLWDDIARDGMRIRVEFMLMGKGGPDHRALLSYGRFGNGFRLLLDPKGFLVIQFGRAGGGKRTAFVQSQGKVPTGRWTTAEVVLSPRIEGQTRWATLRLDKAEALKTDLPGDVTPATNVPVGFGIELALAGGSAKAWPNFPGRIRRVEILPFDAGE
jgi:hypothetical protein